MSSPLEDFRARIRKRLEDRANQAVTMLGRIQYQPARLMGSEKGGGNVAAVPATTVEDIAFGHTIHQAEARILTEMIAAVDEEYRLMIGEPAEPHDPARVASLNQQREERAKKGAY